MFLSSVVDQSVEGYSEKMRQWLAIILFFVFTFVTVFGLPLLLSHVGHHHNCPLVQGGQLCESTVVEHMSAWELLIAFVLGTLAAIFVAYLLVRERLLVTPYRLRFRQRIPERPTLFQELYSSGILNRKEMCA